jgi:PTS system nitrogen regulatory IIA component
VKLVDVIVAQASVLDMRARTKKEALRELAEAVSAAVPELETNQLIETLMEREKLGTTAMGDGIAIPHARLDHIDRIMVSFGKSRAGVDFESVDGELTRLFFLLIAPKKEGSAHLLALARLSRVLSHEEFRQRLLEIEDVDELLRALEQEESKH